MTPSDRTPYTARPGEAVRVTRNDDGSFAIGVGRVRIVTAGDDDMRFVAEVVEDLGRVAHRPEGEAALRRGDAIGHSITIAKPAPPTEPPNAWTIPDDLAAATAAAVALASVDGRSVIGTGAGCGSTIVYNPGDWLSADAPLSPTRVDILLSMIEQANANAAGASNPTRPDWDGGGSR
jgi:hypothetical protein